MRHPMRVVQPRYATILQQILVTLPQEIRVLVIDSLAEKLVQYGPLFVVVPLVVRGRGRLRGDIGSCISCFLGFFRFLDQRFDLFQFSFAGFLELFLGDGFLGGEG